MINLDKIRNLDPIAAAALIELQKRQAMKLIHSGGIRCPEFTKQNEYLEARKYHRFRALNCTRRAAKSVSEAIDHVEVMTEFPRSRALYMGLTAESAMDIGWDAFMEIDERSKVGLKFVKSNYRIHHPNGSVLRFFGIDASAREMRKILGQKIRKVSIDEAGSMTIDMNKLVNQTIIPALTDHAPYSWLTLLGTCENIPNTFFQSLTEGKEGLDWKVFRWTTYDNPFLRDNWDKEIKRILENNPKAREASWFRTHYLNEWCTDDNLMVVNIAKIMYLPFNQMEYPQPRFGLGVDLGFNDDSSFTVVCWSAKNPRMHIVQSYGKSGMDLTDVANEIKYLRLKYPITYFEVDGANKQGVEEIKNRHGLPLEAAEKVDKPVYLNLLKDDINTGSVVVDENGCKELTQEWSHLIWEDADRKKEHPKCKNHRSDSALYIWRKARHYLYRDKPQKPSIDSEEFMQQLQEKEAKQIKKKIQMEEQENNMDGWQGLDDFDEMEDF